MTVERLKELEVYHWNETNDMETQLWREDLTEQERAVVEKWDKEFCESMANILKELDKHNKSRTGR